uniref:TIR domain-containing protein n=1 Tax=Steinernema glaseri TaxID=37863 RepID=A0A1I7Z1K0_9BILA
MDGVPFAFCEALYSTLHTSELGELSGHYGNIARNDYPNVADYIDSVVDGHEKQGYLRYQSDGRKVRTPEEIEAVPKKSVRFVSILIDDGNKVNACREIVNRFPYSRYQFGLHSSSINEAWVDFACSLKRLNTVVVIKKLDEDAIPLFQKFVDGHKLSWLYVCEEACEGGMLALLKMLLCQDQFPDLSIRNDLEGPWKSTVVRDLLHFWSVSSHKLRGTKFSVEHNCEGGVQQLEEFVLRRAAIITDDRNIPTIQEVLTRCSQEECDFLEKYYRLRSNCFKTPSCVYKFEEGTGDKRRKLYISFECNHGKNRTTGRQYASCEGVDDLSLMRGTNSLRVLFF